MKELRELLCWFWDHSWKLDEQVPSISHPWGPVDFYRCKVCGAGARRVVVK